MKLRWYIADILFFVGHKLIIYSAKLMGYADVVEDLNEHLSEWIKTEAFKNNEQSKEESCGEIEELSEEEYEERMEALREIERAKYNR